jgi:hypothetical protein
VHGSRQPHSHPEHATRVGAGSVEHQLHELRRTLDAGLGVVVVTHLAPLLGEHLVRQVGQRDGEVPLAEVDADREPGARVERDEGGRPAATGRNAAVDVAVDDDALRLQRRDDARHRRARQTRAPGEVRPARYSQYL